MGARSAATSPAKVPVVVSLSIPASLTGMEARSDGTRVVIWCADTPEASRPLGLVAGATAPAPCSRSPLTDTATGYRPNPVAVIAPSIPLEVPSVQPIRRRAIGRTHTAGTLTNSASTGAAVSCFFTGPHGDETDKKVSKKGIVTN